MDSQPALPVYPPVPGDQRRGRTRRAFARGTAALAAAGGAGVLAACGAQAQPGASSTTGASSATTAGQPVTLDLWHSWGTVGGGGLAMLDQIEEYKRRFPNVTVVNTADANKQKFITALASDTAPDLFKLQGEEMIEFAEQGALLALDDFIKRDRWDMKQYFDFVVAHTSHKGKVFSITHHPDVRAFFWSKKAFQENGLTADRPPANWGDVEQHAQRLTKREGAEVVRYGFIPAWTSNSWLLQYWQANGAKILSDDGKKPAFNVPQAIDATTWAMRVTDVVNGGWAAVDQWSKAINVAPNTSFALERAATLLFGNWLLFPVSQQNPTLPFGVQAFPGGPGAQGKSFVFGGSTMVGLTKASKKAADAWEYLKFVGSKDGQYLVQKRTTDVAGHREAASNPEIVNNNLGRKEVLPLFEKANASSYVTSPAAPAIHAVLTDVQNRLLRRELTPRDAVTEAAQRTQQELDTYWARQGG